MLKRFRKNRLLPPQSTLTARQRRAQDKTKQLFRVSSTVFYMLLAVISLGMITWGILSPPGDMVNVIAEAKPYLTLWRLLLFVSLIGGWHHWVNILAIWSELETQQIQLLHDYRCRMALWLIILEALITQNLLATFFNTVFNL